MTLTHIDNSYFKLSKRQAQYLSITGKLPKIGMEIKANPDKLTEVDLVYRRGDRVILCQSRATEASQAWILPTLVNHEPVWSLRLYFNP